MVSFKNISVYLLSMVLLAVSGVFLARFYLDMSNSPYDHPEWLFSKSQTQGLENYTEQVNSAKLFTHARLNISECGGYNEVLYGESLALSKVSFRFRADDNAYLLFIGYNERNFFNAFRFSAWDNYRSTWLTGFATGRYKEKVTGRPAIFYPFVWHDVEMHFEGGKILLYVDGDGIAELPTGLVNLTKPGFRCGMGKVEVDDVTFETKDGKIIKEDFSNSRRLPIIVAVSLIALFIIWVMALAILSRIRYFKKVLPDYSFLLASFVFLCAVLLHYAYPMLDMENKKSENFEVPPRATQAQIDGAHAKFAQDYPLEKAKDEVRILVLGSSQAVGDGSKEYAGGYVALLQKYLQNLKPETNTLVMNGAYRGGDAGQLIDSYKTLYKNYGPDIVIVNVGLADDDNANLAADLESLTELNSANSVKTFFMLEAYPPEDPRPRPQSFSVVKGWAEKRGITLVNADKFLFQHRNDGILFWDAYNPTDYGHDIISQSIIHHVIKEVEKITQTRDAPPARQE